MKNWPRNDRRFRHVAAHRSPDVSVIGWLGVIPLAKRRSIIPSARQLLARLDTEASMYLDGKTRDDALRTVGE